MRWQNSGELRHLEHGHEPCQQLAKEVPRPADRLQQGSTTAYSIPYRSMLTLILNSIAKATKVLRFSNLSLSLNAFRRRLKSTSRFRFNDSICLRRWKSICVLNFNEISQSTAGLKLLPLSENGRPPYWNYISGFDFDACLVIGTSFYICLPSFVVICRSAAELWRHIYFLKMAADSHIGFDLGNVRPPTKCYCWSQLDPQIWSWSDL